MSFSAGNSNCKIDGDFSVLEKLIKELHSNVHVKIGILGAASYDNGATIAGIGAVHEFGSLSENIPKWSFLKMPLEKNQVEIANMIKPKMQTLIEKQDVKGIFKILGIAGESMIQKAFDTGGFGTWTDITAETKIKKGSSSILIDAGVLRKSITSKVGINE
jgi:phage gpG-like protein